MNNNKMSAMSVFGCLVSVVLFIFVPLFVVFGLLNGGNPKPDDPSLVPGGFISSSGNYVPFCANQQGKDPSTIASYC